MMSRKPIAGARRGHSAAGGELRTLVRTECLKGFNGELGNDIGVEWNPAWECYVVTAHPTDSSEREARKVLARLHEAIQGVMSFNEKFECGARQRIEAGIGAGPCSNFLGHWAPVHLKPLIRQSAFRIDWPRHGTSRTRFVEGILTFGMLGPLDFGKRKPTSRDLAMMSLLGGTSTIAALQDVRDEHWPLDDFEARTPAEVIRLETDNMSKLLKVLQPAGGNKISAE